MSRLLAAFAVDLYRSETLGLVEKAKGLVAAARAAGHDVTAMFADGTRARTFEGGIPGVPDNSDASTNGVGRRAAAFRFFGFWTAVESQLREGNFDALWLRAHPVSTRQQRLLRSAEEAGVAVYYDIPTYPSTGEAPSLSRRLLSSLTLPLTEIARHIYRFVTVSEHTLIEGRPTVRVRNGVALPSQPRLVQERDGPIRLLGLGQWSTYHGLDRLLHAIAGHPENYRVRIAGGGPAFEGYRKLAARLGVRAEWLPPAFGDHRDGLIAWADGGIGSLAIHRKGVYPDQALKHRVYAAHGLPFLCTTDDPHWAGVHGVWQVSADESAIPSQVLAETLAGFRQNSRDLAMPLRNAAASTSWDRAYAPLFASFNEL